jgi:tetratricopeptide (TPR) repeat protein
MKIWIDDYLIFDNNNNTNFEWDNEVVGLELDPGVHRILVKYSDYNKGNHQNEYFDLGSSLLSSNSYDPSFMYEYDNSPSIFKDLLNFDPGFENHYNGDFELRLTNEQGKLFKNIHSFSNRKYDKKSYKPEIDGMFVIKNIMNQLQSNPTDLFQHFLLLKAYEHYYQTAEGEETIIKFYRSHKDLTFAKYLAYCIYNDNEKKEKAYEVLSHIDESKTPMFDLLYQKLEEIDKVNDEEKYITALENLNEISPSNFNIIDHYIEYFESKDLTEEKEKFIKETIKKFPDYEVILKEELKREVDEKKAIQKEMQQGREDYSYKKNIRELKKDVKNSFYPRDYIRLIRHYQTKGEYEKTLELYDELEKIEPYQASYYYQKATFLYEEQKYPEALQEIEKGIQLRPFDGKYYELQGDIYHEQKDKDNALKAYRTAKKLSHQGSRHVRSRNSLVDKIEKIEGQKHWKKLFQTPSFQDILAKENEWKNLYQDEESVVLMYTRDVVIDSSNHGEAFDKIMIKILNDGGVKRWVEYDFDFLGRIKSARIIKKNGAEVIPDGMGGYKVFKSLEVGDIIQIEGGFQFDVTQGIEESNYFFTYMSFESPTFYNKLEVAVPKGKELHYMHYKIEDNVIKSTEKSFDFYKWEYHNLPKMSMEEATIDKFDYYSSIMISMIPEWSKISTWFNRITYRKLESNYEVREILDSIIKPGMTDRQKVERIYNYLTREIKYSFVPFLQSGYVPKDPGLTICSRIGDCKDVATLMITMLREVGIESYYVLVKTNDYFHSKVLPSIYFNHVIAGYYLDGKMHYSDMTTDFYPYYILPQMDANAWALVVKEGPTELFQLPKDNIDIEKNLTEITVQAKLAQDRTADLNVSAQHRGIAGGNIREKFAVSNKEEQKNYIMDLMGKGIFENADLTNYEFYNMEDISNPLKSDYNFNIINFCDRVSGMLVFRIPYMTAITTNPAILTKVRHNSLDLGEIVNIDPTKQKLELQFPEGFELLEMPDNVDIKNKYGTYKVNFKKLPNGIEVEKYQVFNSSVIDVKEFEEFKKFYLQILDIDSSKIALKKKGRRI